jgi:hypothetical protein
VGFFNIPGVLAFGKPMTAYIQGTISGFLSAIGIPLAIKGNPTNRARAIQGKT